MTASTENERAGALLHTLQRVHKTARQAYEEEMLAQRADPKRDKRAGDLIGDLLSQTEEALRLLTFEGVPAARRAPVVPQGYECGVMTGNRVSLAFDTQANADAWFEQFCDSYDAAAPQPPACNQGRTRDLPEPDAVIRFDRGTTGQENEMPRVISCNWLPDGEYRAYTEQKVRALLAGA